MTTELRNSVSVSSSQNVTGNPGIISIAAGAGGPSQVCHSIRQPDHY